MCQNLMRRPRLPRPWRHTKVAFPAPQKDLKSDPKKGNQTRGESGASTLLLFPRTQEVNCMSPHLPIGNLILVWTFASPVRCQPERRGKRQFFVSLSLALQSAAYSACRQTCRCTVSAAGSRLVVTRFRSLLPHLLFSFFSFFSFSRGEPRSLYTTPKSNLYARSFAPFKPPQESAGLVMAEL